MKSRGWKELLHMYTKTLTHHNLTLLPSFLVCRAKEAEFKNAIADMGRQLTKAKIDANLREMNLLAAAKAREEQLRLEINNLRDMVQKQKDSQATN